jgi:WD40 repeat protein
VRLPGNRPPPGILVWDLVAERAKARLKGVINTHAGNGFYQDRVSVFSPNGSRLAAFHERGSPLLRVWEVDSEQKVASLPESDGPVRSGDGRLLASLIEGPPVVDRAGGPLATWQAHLGRVHSLAISPDGQMLASGGEDRTNCSWELPEGREVARWEAHESAVLALAFRPNGRALVSGSKQGTPRVWDLDRIRRELAPLGLDWGEREARPPPGN